jgi:predicted RNA binding protein YcfA (HicA-like mRNA interferase family)
VIPKQVALKDVLKACERHGFIVEHGGKHLKIRDPKTNRTIPVSCSPSRPYAGCEVLRDIKRYWSVEIEL